MTADGRQETPVEDRIPEGAGSAVDPSTLTELRDAAACCRACELWEGATQTVFGEGPAPADLMLVSEQPGHDEDLTGRPFVGPAGRLPDRALLEAGLHRPASVRDQRSQALQLGTQRQGKNPQETDRVAHPTACRPWLMSELALVRPRALICLGATAAQTLLGRNVRVTQTPGSVDSLAARALRRRDTPSVGGAPGAR